MTISVLMSWGFRDKILGAYAKTCHSFDVRATTLVLIRELHSSPIQDTPTSPPVRQVVMSVQYALVESSSDRLQDENCRRRQSMFPCEHSAFQGVESEAPSGQLASLIVTLWRPSEMLKVLSNTSDAVLTMLIRFRRTDSVELNSAV